MERAASNNQRFLARLHRSDLLSWPEQARQVILDNPYISRSDELALRLTCHALFDIQSARSPHETWARMDIEERAAHSARLSHRVYAVQRCSICLAERPAEMFGEKEWRKWLGKRRCIGCRGTVALFPGIFLTWKSVLSTRLTWEERPKDAMPFFLAQSEFGGENFVAFKSLTEFRTPHRIEARSDCNDPRKNNLALIDVRIPPIGDRASVEVALWLRFPWMYVFLTNCSTYTPSRFQQEISTEYLARWNLPLCGHQNLTRLHLAFLILVAAGSFVRRHRRNRAKAIEKVEREADCESCSAHITVRISGSMRDATLYVAGHRNLRPCLDAADNRWLRNITAPSELDSIEFGKGWLERRIEEDGMNIGDSPR